MGTDQKVDDTTLDQKTRATEQLQPGDLDITSGNFEEISEDAYKQNHVYRVLVKGSDKKNRAA